jgi:delta-aminolevulinic acid dehydratase/porphobilinogen synthase
MMDGRVGAIREHLERIRATRRAVEETSRTRGDKG